jgi:hypothetical protein
MHRGRFKSLIAIAVIALFIFISLVSVRGLFSLFSYFSEAAEPVSPLNLVPDIPPETLFDLEWLPDDRDTGRVMEPFTRRQIESAYIRAWLQLNLSYARQEPYGLKTYFVGPALEAVTENVAQLAANGWEIKQSNRGHQLQLNFYSADGSIVAFTDHNVELTQTITDVDGFVVYEGMITGEYDVVMFLEDGNWRVRHWLRVD